MDCGLRIGKQTIRNRKSEIRNVVLMDRPFVIALSISLACHVFLLGLQLIHLHGAVFDASRSRKALDVIYDATQDEAVGNALRGMQRQAGQITQFGEGQGGGLPGIPTPTPQIRVPERTMGSVPALPSGMTLSRPAVVDLTNLVEAAQGDPVLLTYFSAIREQIQQTANRHTWLSSGTSEGLVYVSFVLAATGQVYSTSVLSDRSTSSRLLQEIALKIIKASGPFPSFPPSLSQPSRTVVVPLEFLLGASGS